MIDERHEELASLYALDLLDAAERAAFESALAADPALAGKVKLLSISFDTEFDTPERLAEYASKYTQDNETWRFATGDAAEVDEAYDFYEQWLSEEARAEGERVLAALLRPFPQALRARPLPRVRFKRRRGGKRESA